MTSLGRPLALVLVAAAIACGGGNPRQTDACPGGLLQGDLVITEIFGNPPSTDAGHEWIEIYNATMVAQQLNGLVLSSAKEDGTSLKDHTIGELAIDPGGYVVLGNVIEDARPDFVDYGYGEELGDLRNTAGQLQVSCGQNVLDTVLYVEVSEGISRGFDGSRTPDAEGNDDLNTWCDATTTFADDIIATPGATNDPCAGSGIPTTCEEDGVVRDIVSPVYGDVVISEVFPNPALAEEGVAEWFEIYVGADVDLNGLTFYKTLEDEAPIGQLAAIECIRVPAGTWFVVAQSDDPEVNGGLPRVDAVVDFALSNTDSSLVIGYGDDVLDDGVAWGTTHDGKAKSLDPDYLTADGNDDPAHFCDAVTTFGLGDYGTPGAANDAECPILPPAGQCNDGSGFIDIVPPGAGDLVITEFHANPAAVDDAAGEWFELRANAPVHLNALELGTVVGEVKSAIEVEECIALGVGDYAILARGDEATVNGGLPFVSATFEFALANSDSGLFVSYGGEVVDQIAWSSTTSGAATSLDGTFTDATDNDDEANWCAAVDPYGAGDLGTPGEENPQCAGSMPSTCNDGGTRRAVVAPQLGDLVITELMPDPSAVADAEGEWFEVLVTADVDLNGLELGTDPTSPDDTLPVNGDCIAVTAGTRVVFARNADSAGNGGIDPVLAPFSFGLANGGGTLFVGYVGEVLDQITWTGASAGTAISLDPDAEDPVSNDDQGNFCDATMPYGAGDLGTPGAMGGQCGGGGGDGMCDDGGVPRAIVSPTLGDLVITEVMANPNAVTDAAGEWFEVLVNADVDLNGLQLSSIDGAMVTTLEQTINDDACLAVTAGTRIVLARNSDMMMNGGLPAVDYAFGFGLSNSDHGLAVGVGDVVLDEVFWASVPAGSSRSLDPGSSTPTDNDVDANWCAASTMYGAGDNGTPGAVNDAC